ncbi:MAG: prepilin-type N-terminal cleavage/methylation domain-containing protein [Deltaproteobacteria bacterium]|nr:prepilin-type N-terminal cleavage/methylation domain-containing protein [Deltaproteobacteria bacterium]
MKTGRTPFFDQSLESPHEQGAGFTIIELIIVIAMIGTLAAIAVPIYHYHIEKARIAKACADIRVIEKEIIAFKVGQGNGTSDLPDSLADIGRGNFPDPWGNPYQYANHDNIPPGDRRKYKSTVPLNTDFDLYSMGPDGATAAPITAAAGYDDIIRAGDGEYVGPASEY